MKKCCFCLIFSIVSTYCFAQDAQLAKTPDLKPADTLSYQIIENTEGINIHKNIELRKKITYHRKLQDFMWQPEEGLAILIFKLDN